MLRRCFISNHFNIRKQTTSTFTGSVRCLSNKTKKNDNKKRIGTIVKEQVISVVAGHVLDKSLSIIAGIIVFGGACGIVYFLFVNKFSEFSNSVREKLKSTKDTAQQDLNNLKDKTLNQISEGTEFIHLKVVQIKDTILDKAANARSKVNDTRDSASVARDQALQNADKLGDLIRIKASEQVDSLKESVKLGKDGIIDKLSDMKASSTKSAGDEAVGYWERARDGIMGAIPTGINKKDPEEDK